MREEEKEYFEGYQDSFKIVVLVLTRDTTRSVHFDNGSLLRMVYKLVESTFGKLSPTRGLHLHLQFLSNPIKLIMNLMQQIYIEMFIRTFQTNTSTSLVQTEFR